VLFKEDLSARGGLGENDRYRFFSTYGYLDEPVLNYAANLAARPGKDFIFVITLTNHTPWEYLPEREQLYFPQPKDKFQNFANSINYVDRCLEEFYERVPDGTLLLIYGDHAAVFEELDAGGDFVPYIILLKDGELVPQDNPPGIRDQQFTLEDIASHIGTLFEQRPSD
jgi:arylsulfatase A-like enzyme